MMNIESASATQDQRCYLYIKRINNLLLVLMIIFAGWYYLPSNQLVRGRDVCSYMAIKENKMCSCFTPAATRIFLPNGTMEYIGVKKYKKNLEDFNVTR